MALHLAVMLGGRLLCAYAPSPFPSSQSLKPAKSFASATSTTLSRNHRFYCELHEGRGWGCPITVNYTNAILQRPGDLSFGATARYRRYSAVFSGSLVAGRWSLASSRSLLAGGLLLALTALHSPPVTAFYRFFQFGFRFSTSARSPSCESSSRYSSFRKMFMEFFSPSRRERPMPPRIAFLAMVSTGPE